MELKGMETKVRKKRMKVNKNSFLHTVGQQLKVLQGMGKWWNRKGEGKRMRFKGKRKLRNGEGNKRGREGDLKGKKMKWSGR